jgi:hypothetical protein
MTFVWLTSSARGRAVTATVDTPGRAPYDPGGSLDEAQP